MLDRPDRFLLRKIARDAIQYGLRHQAPMPVDLESLPASIRQQQACFVTLFATGTLRGCVGSLEAYRPLAEDVAANAFAAAFRDNRFCPISRDLVDELDINISLLTTPQPIECDCEQSLLSQLIPGKDGLILEAGEHRATFLPAVWDALPSPARFVAELKRKAGLPIDYWSEQMQCYRYHTEHF
ncbi:AmmeMemoRadiSam system protein A [uncultured Methylophaga sp.]|uniref:AmmeMemoRadiSam system protein A n=1 Tax=uncultured Methylophaga sp. TaxID=285271 RepID=UPI00261E99FB|nr:AmmeMemoRadiSam system protein A [uncultured Methylophaga sp.]